MNWTSILFFDIETVPATAQYSQLSERMQKEFRRKATYIAGKPSDELSDDEVAALYFDRSGIYSEYGKIVCISAGVLFRRNGDQEYSVKINSWYGDDEELLLQDFGRLLQERYNEPGRHMLCGHNIKEFDVPYLCRRMLVNGIEIPDIIQIQGKKPWETEHLIDTMDLWKFGDRKNFTSLSLLTALFDIPTPKDDIDGSQVAGVYYHDADLGRIARYCEKDVLAVIQLLRKLKLQPIINPDNVQFSLSTAE